MHRKITHIPLNHLSHCLVYIHTLLLLIVHSRLLNLERKYNRHALVGTHLFDFCSRNFSE